MEYRFLGSSGLKVSEIALGTQTFGWNTGPEEAFGMMDAYVARGGNYFDSADSYNGGESERILGEWLSRRKDRNDFIIGTKTYFPTGEGPNDTGLSRKHIQQSVEQSLRNLRVEAIDLYQIHCFDGATDLRLVLHSLNDLVRVGKVRSIGLSNVTPSTLMEMVKISAYEHLDPIATLQLEYSLLIRSPEWELLPLCERTGIGTLAWSPLAGGWLTGKYRRDREAPENSRVGRKDRWEEQEDQRGGEQTWAVIDRLTEIAEDRGAPVCQAALNWLRRKKQLSACLIGARTAEQLKQNLDCLDWSLTTGEEESLDLVSSRALPSPYDFIQRYARRRPLWNE